jgi:hypothetical protein
MLCARIHAGAIHEGVTAVLRIGRVGDAWQACALEAYNARENWMYVLWFIQQDGQILCEWHQKIMLLQENHRQSLRAPTK